MAATTLQIPLPFGPSSVLGRFADPAAHLFARQTRGRATDQVVMVSWSRF